MSVGRLLRVEQIKLFSTRSPYWCLAAIFAASVLFALLFALIDRGQQAVPYLFVRGVAIGQSVFMVLAALAVTTEYRFNTIKISFLAAPRLQVLLAKTIVLAVVGAVTGFVCAMAAFFLGKALASSPPEPLRLAGEVWRETAGYALLFPISAIIAVAVGAIVRQSAGALSIVLIWTLLVEGLIGIIPSFGPTVGPWLPFRAADAFVAPTELNAIGALTGDHAHPGPVGGLLVFLGYAVLFWVIAAVLVQRRDA